MATPRSPQDGSDYVTRAPEGSANGSVSQQSPFLRAAKPQDILSVRQIRSTAVGAAVYYLRDFTSQIIRARPAQEYSHAQ